MNIRQGGKTAIYSKVFNCLCYFQIKKMLNEKD